MARRAAPSLEFVAGEAGIPAQQLLSFYRLFAATERVVTLYSQGVNQSVSGSDKVNAIINCHLATGRIGRPGMGPFSLTGQPNAMGGREVGGLANQLAAHMGFTRDAIDRVGRFWKAPAIATAPGLKAVDLFEAAGDGRLKAIWIAATNPADSMPRADKVREALTTCPLVIVADAWPTDTSRLAHLVLPAATWAEKDGTVTNSERRISRQRAFRAAPGLARPDWWMFAEVGRRMGWDKDFAYSGPADIFREHATLSAFENDGARQFDLGALAGIDDQAYDALAPLQWPAPKHCHAPVQRLFGRGGFSTADGKARMIALTPPGVVREAGSLTFNTGRTRDQWHTMTRTGKVPRLMEHETAPSLAIHPQDAVARGISNQGLVQVENGHGRLVMRALFDPDLRQGDIFASMHWTDQFTSSGPAGRLVHALTDPLSGQPDLKGTPVKVGPLAENWHGILFRADAGLPVLGPEIWWARTPLAKGWRVELAGQKKLEEEICSEAALRRLLGINAEAELVSYSDPRKNLFRYAGFSGGILKAAVFFAGPGQRLGETGRVQALLGDAVGSADRLALLAGRTGAAPGKIICACFSVSETQIRDAIHNRGIASTEGLGKALKAGTNCGSCLPELKKLLMRTPELS
jgi:assimilatory nitrate reductase catalytic subunit